MLGSWLMLAALAAPLEASVVKIDLVRTNGAEATWYNKVEVQLASADGRSVRLCPGQASVTTARQVGEDFKPVGRYPAHAMILADRSRTSGCRDLALAPGQPQKVTFVIREVPGRWRAEDRYTFTLAAGDRLFHFVESSSRAGR